MRAFVTGANGFIGSHLVDALIKRGFSVTCLVRKTSDLKWIDCTSASLVYGDCLDETSLYSAVSDCDFLFHVAGATKAKTEADFIRQNASGTENVIKAVLRNCTDIRRFVLISSQAAAGPSTEGVAIDETVSPSPVSWYGSSKLKAEKILEQFRDKISFSIVRPSAVFGPRDRDMFLLFKTINRGIFPFWGTGMYSMIYIEDLTNAIIAIAESERAKGNTYFVSDSVPYSNEFIASLIANSLGKTYMKLKIPKFVLPVFGKFYEKFTKTGIINTDKIREIRHPYWICSPRKFLTEIGSAKKIGTEKGVKWTADWYRIHRWL